MSACETTPSTKLCTTCWETKPVTDFRRAKRGSDKLRRNCRTCYNSYMRQFRREKRHKTVTSLVRQMVRPSTRTREVKAIVTIMIQHLGGLERFTQTWKEALDAAVRTGDHRFSLQHFFAVCRLVQFVGEMESKQQTPVDDLTDKDIEQELSQLVRQQVAADPTMAVGALAELGWKVVPPG